MREKILSNVVELALNTIFSLLKDTFENKSHLNRYHIKILNTGRTKMT